MKLIHQLLLRRLPGPFVGLARYAAILAADAISNQILA